MINLTNINDMKNILKIKCKLTQFRPVNKTKLLLYNIYFGFYFFSFI